MQALPARFLQDDFFRALAKNLQKPLVKQMFL